MSGYNHNTFLNSHELLLTYVIVADAQHRSLARLHNDRAFNEAHNEFVASSFDKFYSDAPYDRMSYTSLINAFLTLQMRIIVTSTSL